MAKVDPKVTKTTKKESVKVKQAEKAVTPEVTEKLEELIETEKVAEEIVNAEEEITEEDSKSTAKAGKRSAKSQKEAEVLKAKEERKIAGKTDEAEKQDKPKVAIKPPRSRVERAGKKYKKVAELIDKTKIYDVSSAVDLAVKTSTSKFDSSVEMHFNLNVDPRQADQNIRGTLSLPAGTGKTSRIAVFAETDDAEKAKKAGADLVGLENISAELDKEQINFDVLIATPATMAKLAKYAKLLGPKGLMPNPKSGTVAADTAAAVKQAKAGRVEYRVDSTGIVHLAIGKVSFGNERIIQNAQAVIASIKSAKPASIKGNYIKSAYITTTMGPSIKVQVTD